MTPTRPELSRNAISFSPSSISRSGAPSRSSSDDITAGIQYCRIISPIAVPGPTRTRSSLSFCLLIADLIQVVISGCPSGPRLLRFARNDSLRCHCEEWSDEAISTAKPFSLEKGEAEPGAGADADQIVAVLLLTHR